MPDIHLSLGSTPESDQSLDELRDLLSDEERVRIDRIRIEHVRRRQTAALAGLRIALGRALGRDPAALRFARGPYGKPHLEDAAVSFNLTRSEDRFAIGICDRGSLGVDIELGRPIPRLVELARSVFSEFEMSELRARPEAERLSAFYRGWTRKEAFIKAVGTGLHLPLRSFSVTLESDHGNALRSLDDRARSATERVERDGAEWWIAPVSGDLPEGLFAAVAWDRGEFDVHLVPFEWD